MKRLSILLYLLTLFCLVACGGIGNSGGGGSLVEGMAYVFHSDTTAFDITATAYEINPVTGALSSLGPAALPAIFGSNRGIGRDIEASKHGHIMVCHYQMSDGRDARLTAFTANFDTGELVQTGEVILPGSLIPYTATIDDDIIVVCEYTQNFGGAFPEPYPGDTIVAVRYDSETGSLSYNALGYVETDRIGTPVLYEGRSLVVNGDNLYVVGQATTAGPGGYGMFLIHCHIDRATGTVTLARQIPLELTEGRPYEITARSWRAFSGVSDDALVISCDDLADDAATIFAFNLAADGTPTRAGAYDTGQHPLKEYGDPGNPVFYNGRFYCTVPTPQYDTIRAFVVGPGTFGVAPGIPDFYVGGNQCWGLFSFRDLIYYDTVVNTVPPEHYIMCAQVTEDGSLVQRDTCSVGATATTSRYPFLEAFHRQGRFFAFPTMAGTPATVHDLRVMTSDLIAGSLVDIGTYPLPGGTVTANLPAIITKPM